MPIKAVHSKLTLFPLTTFVSCRHPQPHSAQNSHGCLFQLKTLTCLSATVMLTAAVALGLPKRRHVSITGKWSTWMIIKSRPYPKSLILIQTLTAAKLSNCKIDLWSVLEYCTCCTCRCMHFMWNGTHSYSIYACTLLCSLHLWSFPPSLSVLMAIFPGEPGLCGFIESKDDRSGGDNWTCKTCKAPFKA